jgi:uncharacterized membrane protein YfcA
MPDDPTFYLFAIPAVALIGLAKGGFSGLGALGTPLMAIGIGDPVKAAAILLPILIAQDVVGVAAFRRTWDGSILAAMLPGAVVGIGLGYLLAAQISAAAVMAAMGLIAILFGAFRLWVERRGNVEAQSSSPLVGGLFGIVSGFTSQIAHAGGPPFQMWVMPKRLPHTVFVGTSAIFFAVVNWIKVPAYVALGQFTTANAIATLVLLPFALAASLIGVVLVKRIRGERFYTIVYLLMILAGAKLLLDGIGVG